MQRLNDGASDGERTGVTRSEIAALNEKVDRVLEMLARERR